MWIVKSNNKTITKDFNNFRHAEEYTKDHDLARPSYVYISH